MGRSAGAHLETNDVARRTAILGGGMPFRQMKSHEFDGCPPHPCPISSALSRLNLFDGGHEAVADVVEAAVVEDLLAAALVGDVEDIDDLIEIGADLGRADGEAELEQRARDGVEQ